MESILLRLINTKLGKFVETVDAGALETHLLSGVIRLRNLRIKSEALASLKLPVKVVYGFVKDIKVEFSPMAVSSCAVPRSCSFDHCAARVRGARRTTRAALILTARARSPRCIAATPRPEDSC